MAQHAQTDAERIENTHNTARFFTENRSLSWVLLVGTVVWGIWGYIRMPKRKDPSIPAMVAAAVCPWPGIGADRIEQQVARRIEEAVVQNPRITKVESLSQTSAAIVLVYPDEKVADVGREFDDVKLRLDGIHDLPSGAGPIEFIKDFGDTAALMLTVASPKTGSAEIAWRAKAVGEAIRESRAHLRGSATQERASVIVCFPLSVRADIPKRLRDLFLDFARQQNAGRGLQPVDGPGFTGVDGDFGPRDDQIRSLVDGFYNEHLRPSERHPDMWPYAVIHDPTDAARQLTSVAADKYSYRELSDFTELIQRTLQTVPLVSRVTRSGVLKENIYLEYSQQRLASFGLQPSLIGQILSARNISFPGGLIESRGKTMVVDPTGEFRNEREIGDVIIGASGSGSPMYLRDSVDIIRGYEAPRYLNFYGWRDQNGQWQRTRAITLGVQMRAGEQIAEFGEAVNRTLDELKRRLPPDLLLQRVSDQPLQVQENINLFMKSLYEAILLVVLVALVGFWEWRSAVLMALAIPITLAMTFGMMYVLDIDVQQVSIASLIIALGLLVDDPVVAGDAIRRDLAAGLPRLVAAWLGPTRLATAIVFATITNIVAYLPLLLVSGDTGRFIYSLPIVLTCSLVASRLVSMTFVPLLGYYLLRAPSKPEASIEERRQHGFGGFYYRLGDWMLRRRWLVFAGSLILFPAGFFLVSSLRTQFFPKDLSYLFYLDVWLPEDSTFSATDDAANRAEEVVRQVAADFGKEHPGPDRKPRAVLNSVTTFVGGGGPRFWFSATPELPQLNYAQLIIRLNDKHDGQELVTPLQTALTASVPGPQIDVRQLETGKPIGVPVAIRISGPEIDTLRGLAEKARRTLERLLGNARSSGDRSPRTPCL
jgi:multidrug efflux pump subunit AcrB